MNEKNYKYDTVLAKNIRHIISTYIFLFGILLSVLFHIGYRHYT